MGRGLYQQINTMPQSKKSVKPHNLFDSFYKIVSRPVEWDNERNRGHVVVTDIIIYARRRFGKSTSADKISQYIIESHPTENIQVVASQSFQALIQRAGDGVCPKCGSNYTKCDSCGISIAMVNNPSMPECPVIILIHDDPIKSSFSRGGTNKQKGQDIIDYEEIAHIIAKKVLEKRIEREWLAMPEAERPPQPRVLSFDEFKQREKEVACNIFVIRGPQGIKMFEKQFRYPDIVLFKSTLPEDERIQVSLLNNQWSYYRMLQKIESKIVRGERDQMKWCIGSIDNKAGFLKLDFPDEKYSFRDRLVEDREDRKRRQNINEAQKITKLYVDVYANPDFNPADVKPSNEIVYATMLKMYPNEIDMVRKYHSEVARLCKDKWIRDTKGEKVVVNPDELNGDETRDEIANITYDDNIYSTLHNLLVLSRPLWKNDQRHEHALYVWEKYVEAWKQGIWHGNQTEGGLQRKIADSLHRSTNYVSSLYKRRDGGDMSICNLLQGPKGGKALEIHYANNLRNQYPEEKIYTEQGNYHEPDVVRQKDDNPSIPYSVKLSVSEKAKTRVFHIEKHCAPEFEAVLNGEYTHTKKDGQKIIIPVGEKMVVVFCCLAWGSYIIATEPFNPHEIEAIKFFREGYEFIKKSA